MSRLFAVLTALLVSTAASAEPAPTTLAKLSMAPKEFSGQVVKVEVSMGMVVSQKLLSYCKGKDKAIQVMPRLEVVSGAGVASMGAMGTVMYQVCQPLDQALELAEMSAGAPLDVVGEVKAIRKVGILVAIVFEDAEVTVVEGGTAAGVLAAPAPADSPAAPETPVAPEAPEAPATPEAPPAP